MVWRLGWISPEAHERAVKDAHQRGVRNEKINSHWRSDGLSERIGVLEHDLEAARAMNGQDVIRELAHFLKGS